MGNARGLFEYLFDVDLDETFNAADHREQGARIERVTQRIERQKNPVTRGMLEAYADQVASRLDVVRSAPNALAALKRRVLAKAREAQMRVGPRPSEARIEFRTPGQDARKNIVGALLDFPMLLDDSEVREVLPFLPSRGESARDRGGASRQWMRVNERGEKSWTSPNSLRKCLPRYNPSPRARLTKPEHEVPIEDAPRRPISVNAKNLQDSNVARETKRGLFVSSTESSVTGTPKWRPGEKHAHALVRQKARLDPEVMVGSRATYRKSFGARLGRSTAEVTMATKNRDRKEVQQLIEMGKSKGFLTYDEVNDAQLPADMVADQMDDVLGVLGDEDIEIVDARRLK